MKYSNYNKRKVKLNPRYVLTTILLLIALMICELHQNEIDSFFGYSPLEDEITYTATYDEASFRRKPDPSSSSIRPQHSDSPERISEAVSTINLAPDPKQPPEPTPELNLSSESTFVPTAEPSSVTTSTPTLEPTPEPTTTATPTQEPNPDSTPEPTLTLDLFSCLGEYEGDNGNSIIIQLDTQFHEMKYAMQFYYNGGFARILGDDGYRAGSDYSNILFTVKYNDETYPFTIQVGDGCINVSNVNQFGPFDGYEFAGTYYMTRQYTVPGWISGT